jgi:hypothetical protein
MLLVSGMRADARAHRLARLAADRAAARSYGEPAITTATQSWDIYLVRPKAAKWIGTVEAADSDSAIEDAAKLDHCDLEAGRWQLLCEDAAGPAMPTMRMSTGGSFVATQVLPRPQFFAFSAVICTKSETNRCGMSLGANKSLEAPGRKLPEWRDVIVPKRHVQRVPQGPGTFGIPQEERRVL